MSASREPSPDKEASSQPNRKEDFLDKLTPDGLRYIASISGYREVLRSALGASREPSSSEEYLIPLSLNCSTGVALTLLAHVGERGPRELTPPMAGRSLELESDQ